MYTCDATSDVKHPNALLDGKEGVDARWAQLEIMLSGRPAAPFSSNAAAVVYHLQVPKSALHVYKQKTKAMADAPFFHKAGAIHAGQWLMRAVTSHGDVSSDEFAIRAVASSYKHRLGLKGDDASFWQNIFGASASFSEITRYVVEAKLITADCMTEKEIQLGQKMARSLVRLSADKTWKPPKMERGTSWWNFAGRAELFM